MISDALVAAGCEVIHLTDRGPEPHRLQPAARIVDGHPVYDVGEQQALST